MSRPASRPLVNEPMPTTRRWGEPELARLKKMVEQDSLFYWGGPQTRDLLAEFSRLYPLKHAFACSSGTAALHVAIAALRLRPGDEVIVPPITDMGSVSGILFQQGVPVFADLDPHAYTLDPASIRRVISPRTRAVLAVHLAGNPAPMAEICALAREHGLAVIEDCAQAWGAKYCGSPVGCSGDLACYSFNDYKHISAGDGGIVATNDSRLGTSLGKWGDKSYDRAAAEVDPALLRDPADLATNYRITEPQSAIAAAQLARLPGIVAGRVRVGERLSTRLREVPGIRIPLRRDGDTHSYWFYLFRLELARFRIGRAEFAAALRDEGVVASAGYLPKPVYAYRVFQAHNFFGGHWPIRDFGVTKMDYTRVRCPVAEGILEDSILLKVHEAMSDAHVDKVASAIAAVAERQLR